MACLKQKAGASAKPKHPWTIQEGKRLSWRPRDCNNEQLAIRSHALVSDNQACMIRLLTRLSSTSAACEERAC